MKKYKVKLIGNVDNKLMLRPFYPNENVVWVDNIEDADFILAPSTSGHTSMSYSRMVNHPLFKQYENKFAIYVNDDNPEFLYDNNKCIKWVAQPSRKKEENIKHNIKTIPLIMSDHYHIDEKIISELRRNKKEYDFCFIGGTGYWNRDILKNIEHPRYYFEDTSNFDFFNKKDELSHLQAVLNFPIHIDNVKKFAKISSKASLRKLLEFLFLLIYLK